MENSEANIVLKLKHKAKYYFKINQLWHILYRKKGIYINKVLVFA